MSRLTSRKQAAAGVTVEAVIFRQFVDDDLGCASYLVGDEETQEAVVVDPAYAIEQYLAAAEQEGVQIARTLETHTHADHVSGHGRLALAHGIPVAIHPAAEAGYEHDPLEDGQEMVLGNIALRVIHTPGHRPEHCCFAVIDRTRAEEPWLVLTGDSLFVGDAARPDLAVEAVDGARELYASLQRLLELTDGVEVFPGHVAGSLCGASMSSKASTTIGFERRFNPMLETGSEDEFVSASALTRSPRPPNLERIVELNRGPFLGAPLTCHGRPLGALYLARTPGAAPFAPEDDRFVKTVQSWLQQGDLLDETRLLGRLRLLNQVAQATAGSMDLASILRVALHELERHLPLNVCAVWLLQQEGNVKKDKGKPRKGAEAGAMDASAGGAPQFLKLAAVNSAPPKRAADLGLIPGLKLEAEQTPFAEPLQNAQGLYLDLERPEAQHSALTANLAAHGGNSTFIVPLRTGHNTVGVLQSVCLRASGFSHEHIELLYLVADLLGPAISSCQLYGRLRSAFEELRHTQNQLVRSEKMRALGEMAGGMAHDFNNALCGSLGFIELALTDAGLTPSYKVNGTYGMEFDGGKGHALLSAEWTQTAATPKDYNPAWNKSGFFRVQNRRP